jgi:hypothetical protein
MLGTKKEGYVSPIYSLEMTNRKLHFFLYHLPQLTADCRQV